MRKLVVAGLAVLGALLGYFHQTRHTAIDAAVDDGTTASSTADAATAPSLVVASSEDSGNIACDRIETRLATHLIHVVEPGAPDDISLRAQDASALADLIEEIRATPQCSPTASSRELPPEMGELPHDCKPALLRQYAADPTQFRDPFQSTATSQEAGQMPDISDTRLQEVFEKRMRIQSCLMQLAERRFALTAARLSDKRLSELERAEDVTAVVMAKLLGEDEPDPAELEPYAARLLELDPRSPTGWRLALKLAYARYASAVQKVERYRAAVDLQSLAARARQNDFDPGRLDTGIRAALARFERPHRGLAELVRNSPDLQPEERAYFLAWDAADRGRVRKALALLGALESSILGDYALLARIARHRLLNPRPDEPAFLDPSVYIGYFGQLAAIGTGMREDAGQPAAMVFGSGHSFGPTSWNMLDRLSNVPQSVRDEMTQPTEPVDEATLAARERELARLLTSEGVSASR